MSTYISNEVLRELRSRRGLTQEQLAAKVGVTAKAVSKWETGRGLPDVSLLEPLAAALGVSVAELVTGSIATNANRSANVRRGLFYVCPICGNVIWTMGEVAASCCGSQMIPLEAESCANLDEDDAHLIHVERCETDHLVTIDHPMTKQHFISFIACVTSDQVRIQKLYPEQEALARFSIRGACDIYAYCNRHGLYKTRP